MGGTARDVLEVSRPHLYFAGSSLERFERDLEKLLAGRDLPRAGAHCRAWQAARAAAAIHSKHKLIEHLHRNTTFPQNAKQRYSYSQEDWRKSSCLWCDLGQPWGTGNPIPLPMALEVAVASAPALPLQPPRDPPQTGREFSLPEKPVFQLLCAAKATERSCITATDPSFCVSNPKAQGFFPFCAAQSSSNFCSPSGILPWGFLHQLGTGHGWGGGAACGAVPE